MNNILLYYIILLLFNILNNKLSKINSIIQSNSLAVNLQSKVSAAHSLTGPEICRKKYSN